MYVSRWGKHAKGLKTCHETDVGHSTSVSQSEKLAEERFHGHEKDVRSAMSVSRWGKHVKGLKTCHETDVGQSTYVSQREKLAEERFHGHETDVRSAMYVSRQGRARQDKRKQDRTEQEKRREDKRRQDKTRQDRTGPYQKVKRRPARAEIMKGSRVLKVCNEPSFNEYEKSGSK